MKFSSRRCDEDPPAKAPTTILSLRQSLQNLSIERAIGVVDRMGAVSTAYANPPAAMRNLVDEHCFFFNPGIERCPSDSGISIHKVEILILM